MKASPYTFDEAELKVLALRACDGDELAYVALCRAMHPMMSNQVNRFYGAGLEPDDLWQEARLGLLDATQSFDGVRPFAALATTIVQRRLIDTVKATQRFKHKHLNHASSLTTPYIDGSEATLQDVLPGGIDPADRLEQAEALRAFVDAVGLLRGLEERVVRAVLNTSTFAEAVESLGITYKAADNAMQRVRRKLGPALEAA